MKPHEFSNYIILGAGNILCHQDPDSSIFISTLTGYIGKYAVHTLELRVRTETRAVYDFRQSVQHR